LEQIEDNDSEGRQESSRPEYEKTLLFNEPVRKSFSENAAGKEAQTDGSRYHNRYRPKSRVAGQDSV
jgi:hypothetical protein